MMGNSTVGHPTIFAIESTHSVFDGECFIRNAGAFDGGFYCSDVVGMHGLKPSLPHLFRNGAPCKGEPGTIEVVGHPLLIILPDEHRARIGEGAKPRFAFTQRPFDTAVTTQLGLRSVATARPIDPDGNPTRQI